MDEKAYPERTAIIKDHALKEFDKIDSADCGWAGANVEVDYSAKLVFSDDDDENISADKK